MPLAHSVTRSNVPQNVLLRWNIEKAAIEFAMTPIMLSRALAQISAAAGADGCYSTGQICEALFGVMHQEKLATQKELTKRYRLDNEITEGNALNRAELSRCLATVAASMVSRINSANVPRSTKEDLLRELASIPLVLKDVARAQSRLPSRGKGKRNDGEGDDGSED
jgi:hypothetical protein